jgi:hypothetical protein
MSLFSCQKLMMVSTIARSRAAPTALGPYEHRQE